MFPLATVRLKELLWAQRFQLKPLELGGMAIADTKDFAAFHDPDKGKSKSVLFKHWSLLVVEIPLKCMKGMYQIITSLI